MEQFEVGVLLSRALAEQLDSQEKCLFITLFLLDSLSEEEVHNITACGGVDLLDVYCDVCGGAVGAGISNSVVEVGLSDPLFLDLTDFELVAGRHFPDKSFVFPGQLNPLP